MAASSISNRAVALVSRQSEPWRNVPMATYDPVSNPEGIISFANAENEMQAVSKSVTSKSVDFTYRGITAGGPDLPTVWAAHVNEYLKPSKQIETSDILFSAAATAMHDILAWALADPGDVFLTSRPVYGRFEFDFATRPQVGIHYVDTDAENCFQEGVVEEFEKAIVDLKARGINAKGVVIVNPHNPLGRCYPKDTLIELMKFCCKHKIHLISDEIYACSVFDSGEPDVVPFTSVLSIDAEKYIDSSYLHVLYSLSKTFAAASRNLGSLITRNKLLAAALADTLEYSVPSGASIAVSRAILGDKELCAKLIAKNRDNLTKAYRHAADGLKNIGVAYLPGSNAGFFLWIDLSPYMDHNEKDPDFALAQRILDAGVVLHARAERALTPGWFRFVYTHDPATVTEGLRRKGFNPLSTDHIDHATGGGSHMSEGEIKALFHIATNMPFHYNTPGHQV